MAAPKLTKAEQKTIIQLLAEGEPYASIARQVGCSWQAINYYASTYGEEIEAARAEYNKAIINQGFANKEYRIRKLDELAQRIQAELDKSLYIEEVKISSTGQIVRYDIFNRGMAAELRGLADDLAKEKGDRKNTTEITGSLDAPFLIKVVYGDGTTQPTEQPKQDS